MSADGPRLFAALRVPPDLQAGLVPDRREVPGDWRWVDPEGLHITLVFLGTVPAGEVPAITEALTPLADLAPIPIAVGGLSGFPQARQARVLIRDVALTPALAELQSRTAALLAPWSGPDRHGPYRPHVTLARHRRGASVPALAMPTLDWTASTVVLIESVRNSKGATYVDRASIALGG